MIILNFLTISTNWYVDSIKMCGNFHQTERCDLSLRDFGCPAHTSVWNQKRGISACVARLFVSPLNL